MLFRCLPLFVSLFRLALADANSTCYYPNGVANHGAPCNSDADVSVCCGPTFVCLSNGLCQVGPDTRQTHAYKFYRSGCTDPTFTSPSCPKICTGRYNLDAGQGLQNCGNDQYCCAENYDCCSNSTNIFSLGVGDIVTTIPARSAATESSKPAPRSPSKSVAIGAGVGVGIGGLLVVCVAVLLLLRRRQRQKATSVLRETAELDSASLARYSGDAKARYSAGGSTNAIHHELASNEKGQPHEMDGQTAVELDSEPEPRDRLTNQRRIAE